MDLDTWVECLEAFEDDAGKTGIRADDAAHFVQGLCIAMYTHWLARLAGSSRDEERAYLRQHYSPSGRIADPVLTMHTTYDPVIPGRFVSQYDESARLAGTQDLFVAKFVVASGHCNFTPAQTGTALDELLAWIREKKRPAAGEIR